MDKITRKNNKNKPNLHIVKKEISLEEKDYDSQKEITAMEITDAVSSDNAETVSSETYIIEEHNENVNFAKIHKDTPSKRQRKKRKLSLPNLIFRIVLLVLLVALVVYGVKLLISLSVKLKPDTIENAVVKDIPVTTAGTLAYDNFQRGVLVANNGNVSYYNSSAKLLWEQQGFDGLPIIDVGDRYALVSYTGTPNALLFNGPHATPITGNGKIITASINENGYSALVMTEEGYKNQIIVLNNNGELIYRWHSGESYITGVAISPDNSGMTVSTVNFGSSTFTGSILMFDFSQEKPYTGQSEEDNMIMDIRYVSDKKIAVIGDKTTAYYKINGNKISNIDYSGKKLTTFDVCDDGHTILCFAKDDSFMSNSDIYSYTTSGKQIGHYETNGRALSVSCSNKRILVARERQFDILSEKCEKITTMAVVKDIKNCVLFDKGKYAFSISGNSAQIIKVR